MDIGNLSSFVVTLGTNDVNNLVINNLSESGRLPAGVTADQVRVSFPATGGCRITYNRDGIKPRKPRTPSVR